MVKGSVTTTRFNAICTEAFEDTLDSKLAEHKMSRTRSHPPAWMMSLEHSLQGNKATYIVQPFTSALFLFIMAFSSA